MPRMLCMCYAYVMHMHKWIFALMGIVYLANPALHHGNKAIRITTDWLYMMYKHCASIKALIGDYYISVWMPSVTQAVEHSPMKYGIIRLSQQGGCNCILGYFPFKPTGPSKFCLWESADLLRSFSIPTLFFTHSVRLHCSLHILCVYTVLYTFSVNIHCSLHILYTYTVLYTFCILTLFFTHSLYLSCSLHILYTYTVLYIFCVFTLIFTHSVCLYCSFHIL